MLETLRNLLKEVSAILAVLRNTARNESVSSVLVERIQELVLTWSVSVRPGLAAISVPGEVLNKTDLLTSKVARLVGGPASRDKCLVALGAVRHVLLEQVLLEVAKIPAAVQAAALAIPASATLFPEISDLPNQLVPYALQGWSSSIREFLRSSPFGKNVFIMVSYRAKLAPLVKSLKARLVDLRLNPVVAREHRLTDDLYNPVACLLCCSYGVAVFDRPEISQIHNPNVVYELGMMQLLKRPCVILKHRKLKKMPSDLLSKLYEDYSSRADAVKRVSDWWDRINK